jgi:hypothetical protein
MPSKQMVEFSPPLRAHQADDNRFPTQMQMGGGEQHTRQIGCSAEVSQGGNERLPIYTIFDQDPLRPKSPGVRAPVLPTAGLGGK